MIGRTLSHYRIVAELGAGGMGVVYRARDLQLERFVALKLLSSEAVADEVRRRRFLQEARAASALNHPNIVTIHDVAHEGSVSAIVMELIEGKSLHQRLLEGPLPVREALRVARQIADALGAAHAAGIIHRDLKPANVMLTGRGIVKVLDFGIAKLDPLRGAGDDTTQTSTPTAVGAVVGTVSYMSPEQARGEVVDARTDVFSLGVLTYEMLTGRSPFSAPALTATLHKLLYEEPPDLASQGLDLPPGVAATVHRAMAKERDARFHGMDAFGAVLDDLIAGREAVVALPASTPALPVRRRSRTMIAGIAILVLALSGAAWWAASRSTGSGGTPATDASVELPATPFEAYQLGQSLLARYDRDGYIDRSIESFRRALEMRPDYPAASAGLGMAYWRKYREQRDRTVLEYADGHARRAVELDPNLTLGLVSVGLVAAERGEFAAAEKALGEALTQDPQSAEALAARAHLRMQQRNLPLALEDVRKARALRADDWSFALMEGVILMSGGQYADAVPPLIDANNRVPDSALVLRNLGAAYYALERYPEAVASFQRALEIKPDPAVYNNLGTIFFFRGLYEQAAGAFDRAVQMRPNDFRFWSSLADSYRLLPGRKTDATRAYTRALQILDEQLVTAPGSLDLLTRRVGLLAKRGDCGEAMQAASRLDLAGGSAAETYRSAVAQEVCGHRDDAVALVEKAIAEGYSLDEVRRDPEMERLRADVRFHQFLASLPP